MEECFVYKWTHKPSLNWYIGSRTRKNCHINDGYLTSSKIVKPMILANPKNWTREIVAIGSQQDIRNLEAEILVLFDAQNDKRSLNQYNQNGKFICLGHSIETIEKIKKNSKWAGKSRPEHSSIMKGKKRKAEDVKKWADKLRGKPFTQEHIDALKKSFRKFEYITPNGIFQSSRDAAKANNCSKSSVLQKINGFFGRGVWYPPVNGWYCKKRD